MAKAEMTITPEGRQRLNDELEWREGERSNEIVEAIKEARAQGDLSENAEYDAAKEDQSKNESRITEIRHILATAKVAQTAGELEVSIGSSVELEDAKGKRTTFTIVGTTETNSLKHMISNESPAGAVLIGRTVGDHISFTTPNGRVREYTIVNISR
jgi:transcription elongation factor GreA